MTQRTNLDRWQSITEDAKAQQHADAIAIDEAVDKREVRRQEALRLRVVRISFALPEQANESDVAHYLQRSIEAMPKSAPIDLGISFGYGVGAWGVEKCVHIETATAQPYSAWVRRLLATYGQTCAYVCINGCEAWELNVAGHWSPITGVTA